MYLAVLVPGLGGSAPAKEGWSWMREIVYFGALMARWGDRFSTVKVLA
jgi:hypothetical protein